MNEFFKCLNNFIKGMYKDQFFTRSIERIKLMELNKDIHNTEFLSNFYCNQFLLTGKINNSPKYCENKIHNVTKNQIAKLAKEILINVFIACETHK